MNEVVMEDEVVLSIVIPVYNEQNNIQHMVQRVLEATLALNLMMEIILVDDGSSDESWHIINQVCDQYDNVAGLKLSRNFGHQHALAAGLENAKGKAVISMDGDLQHPPELIPDMVDAWRRGNKIVNTQRMDKQVFSFFKRTSSRLFYSLFSKLSEVKLKPGSSDFRLIDRDVLATILSFGDADLFWRGAVQWVGYPNTTIPFVAEERYSGESKYTFKKMVKFASSAIVSFSTLPLKVGIWLGLVTSVLAFMELIYVVIAYQTGSTVPGWASAVGIMSLLFGIMFLCIGVMGIYLARIYAVLQRRPRFIIEEKSQASDKTVILENKKP